MKGKKTILVLYLGHGHAIVLCVPQGPVHNERLCLRLLRQLQIGTIDFYLHSVTGNIKGKSLSQIMELLSVNEL